MTAIITQSNLGVSALSLGLSGASGGNAATGRSGEALYVNAATGNLIVQRQDDILMSRGPDANVLHTYNSLAQSDGDNNDNWRIGFYRQVTDLVGRVNSTGSSVMRTDADGAKQLFTWDGAKYVSREGAGSYDTLAFSSTSGRWTWTDGDSRVVETFDWSGGKGNLLSQADTNGNTTSFIYSGGLLRQVNTSSGGTSAGERIYLDYTGVNLTQIRTIANTSYASDVQGSVQSTATRVRYTYDTSNRLNTVTVDLSPEDNSVSDRKTYVTTYAYEGSSKRIATLTQSDGTNLAFTYLDGRVASVTDALGNVTLYAYVTLDNGASQTTYTDVTDPLGLVTRYEYDASKNLRKITSAAIDGVSQVRSFAYNANGDVLSITDAEGNTVHFNYDARGNQTQQTDALDNVVSRSFTSTNQLLTEEVTVQGSVLTTRYVYDAAGKNYLRFVISPEGRVMEHRYDGFGQRTSTIRYSANDLYSAAGAAESDLASWVGNSANKALSERTDMCYNFRGQVSESKTYSSVDSAGNGVAGSIAKTTYVYSQTGKLIQVISPLGGASQTTAYAYDALGRMLSSTNGLGEITQYQYGDTVSNNHTTATQTAANGLRSVSTYDRAGRLVSVMRSNAASVNLGTTRFFYDKNDRLRMTQVLAGASDTVGVREWGLYDNAGRKVGELDGNGSLTEYIYNKNDQLTQTLRYANPAVNAASLTVDANGNPTAAALALTIASVRPNTSVDDQKSWNAYDKMGRLLKTVGTSSVVTVNGVARVHGAVTENHYDSAGRVIRIIEYVSTIDTTGLAAQPTAASISPTADIVNDRVSRLFYDKDDLLLASLDAEGYLTETLYNAKGEDWKTIRYATPTNLGDRDAGTLDQLRAPLLLAQNANDRATYKLYDARGDIAAEVDGNGYLTEYVYDVNGNLKKAKSYATPVSGSITVTSTLAGIRPSGVYQLAETMYDALDRISSQTDAEGMQTSYEYDSAGNVVRTTMAVGLPEVRVLTKRYDLQGRVTGDLNGLGSAQLIALGANAGQAQIDAIYNQYGTTFNYDDADRLTTRKDPNGNVTRYYYNADGDVVYTINALGEVKAVSYNSLEQVRTETTYSGRIANSVLATLFGGLVDSAVTSAVNAIANAGLDSITTLTYTQDGSLASSTDAVVNVTSYQYNAFGEQIHVNSEGRANATSYDRKGQATRQIVDPSNLNIVTKYEYDFQGRKTSVVEAFGTAAARTTLYDYYDAQKRMQETVDPNGLNMRTQFSYDRDGNVLNKTRFSNGAASENRVTRYVYDNENRLRFAINGEGGITETRYDGEGRVVQTKQYAEAISDIDTWGQLPGVGQVQDFINANSKPGDISQRNYYDQDGRLTHAVDSVGAVTKYSYDKNGNLAKQIAYASFIALDADPANVQTNAAKDQVTRNLYDGANRLVLTVDAVGAATKFEYDAAGNVSKQTAYANGLARTVTVRAMADNFLGSPLMELWLNGSKVAEQSVSSTSYTDYVFNLAWPVEGTANFDIVFNNDYANFPGDRNLYVAWINIDGASYLATDAQYDLGTNTALTNAALDGIDVIPGQSNLDRNGALRFTVPAASLPSLLAVGNVQASNADQVTSYIYNAANQKVYSVNGGTGSVSKYDYDANGNLVQETAYATPLSNKSLKLSNPQDGLYHPVGGVTLGWFNAGDTVTMTAYFRGDTNQVAGRIQLDGYTGPGWDSYAAGYSSATVYSNGDWQMLVVTTTLTQDMWLAAWIIGNNGVNTPAGMSGYYDNVVVKSVQRGVVLNERFETSPWGHGTLDSSLPAIPPTDANEMWTMVVADPARDRVTRNVYDTAGRLAYEIDAEGYVTAYTYNALSNVTSLTRYAEKIPDATRFGWDSIPPSSATVAQNINTNNGLNRTIRKDYTSAGLVEFITMPQVYASGDGLSVVYMSPVTKNVYNAFGEVINTREKKVDGSWLDSFRYYDQRGLERATVDAGGYLTKQDYDAFGNVSLRAEYARAAAGATSNAYTMPALDTNKDRSRRYSYDRDNRKLTETRVAVEYSANSLGTSTRGDLTNTYEYDAFGNQIKMTDAQNRSTFSYYDQANRVTALVEPVRAVRTMGDNLTVQDTLNFVPVTEFVRDAFGNVTQQIERATSASNILAASYAVGSNANDRIRRLVYDSRGNAIQSIDPLGNSEFKSYDAMGQLTRQWQTVTDANGLASTVYTQFNYNRVGQLSSTSQPAAVQSASGSATTIQTIKKTQFEYNAFGELARKGVLGFGNGYSEYFDMDNNGRVWRSNSGDGVNKVMLYDLQGNLTAELRSTNDLKPAANVQAANTSSGLQRARNSYNNLGQLTRQNLQNGAIIDQTFDRWGNRLSVSTAGSPDAITTYTYNDNNQVLSEIKPSELLFNYSANAASNLYTYQRPETRYYYDYAGNQVAVRDARNNVNGLEYDSAGNVTWEYHADGGRVQHTFNAFNNEITRTTSIENDKFTTYYYDKLGQLKRIARPGADFYAIDSSAFNTATPVSGFHDISQEGAVKYYWAGDYSFDENQQNDDFKILKWTRSLGVSSGYSVTAHNFSGNYDTGSASRDLITGVSNEVKRLRVAGNFSNPLSATVRGAPTWIDKAYDERGRLLRTTDGAGNTIAYRYDLQGNITVSNVSGTQTNAIYDLNGRKVFETDANNNVQSWTYDYFGRLIDRVDLGGANYDYQYNYLGQLDREINTVGRDVAYYYYGAGNGAGQLSGIVENMDNFRTRRTDYAYDIAGRRATEETRFEPVDPLLVNSIQIIQKNSLQYNKLGQLIKVQADGGASSGRWLEYKYDAMGNRMYSAENFGGSSVGDLRTSYFAYDTMNRQILVDGVANNDASNNANLTEARGFRISYDQDGNRSTEISGSGGWRQNSYEYDSLGRLITKLQYTYDWDNGIDPGLYLDAELRHFYDKADRLIAVDLGNDKLQVSRYNTKGLLNAQAIVLGESYGYGVESLTSNIYDNAGNLTQAESRGTGYINTTTYAYSRLGDTYKQESIKTVQVVRQPGNFAWKNQGNGQEELRGSTQFKYDVNGTLSSFREANNYSATNLDSDVNGVALKKTRMYGGYQEERAFNLVANGQVLGTWGTGERDFIAYQAIDADFGSGGQQTYQVRAGDTLRTIAAAVFGDAQMWYLIAEANSLGDTDLSVGQTLVLPNRASTVHNNAATFEPYNAAKFVGDTRPIMPTATAWQPSQCAQVGIMVAAIAASILIGIAATAATVATLGLASVAVTPAAAVLISAVIGAAAGATASMVSQGIMVAGKLQGQMNWAEVGISAGVGFATGLFSGGMSVLGSRARDAALAAKSAGESVKASKTALLLGADFSKALNAGKAGNIAMKSQQLKYLRARMLLEGAVDAGVDAGAQGVRMAAGIQEKFDWVQTAGSFSSGASGGFSGRKDLGDLIWKTVPVKTSASSKLMQGIKAGLNHRSTAVALTARTVLGGLAGAGAGLANDAATQAGDLALGNQSEWNWSRLGIHAAIGAAAGATTMVAGVTGRFNEKTSLQLAMAKSLITTAAKTASTAVT
jgi:YD repeat-containing protein